MLTRHVLKMLAPDGTETGGAATVIPPAANTPKATAAAPTPVATPEDDDDDDDDEDEDEDDTVSEVMTSLSGMKDAIEKLTARIGEKGKHRAAKKVSPKKRKAKVAAKSKSPWSFFS